MGADGGILDLMLDEEMSEPNVAMQCMCRVVVRKEWAVGDGCTVAPVAPSAVCYRGMLGEIILSVACARWRPAGSSCALVLVAERWTAGMLHERMPVWANA